MRVRFLADPHNPGKPPSARSAAYSHIPPRPPAAYREAREYASRERNDSEREGVRS